MSSHLALYKKMKKNERSRHGDNIDSINNKKNRGKYSQCLAFDIKQSPAGRSPEDHQVQTHAYLSSNNAQSCFVLPLSVLVCSSLNV